MVPDGWYGGEQNALSHVMVEDYIAKFGGTSPTSTRMSPRRTQLARSWPTR